MPCAFLVLQYEIKTEPEDPLQPQEPKADEKLVEEQQEKEAGQLPDTESARVVKSDAEIRQQPPEEAATWGEKMHEDKAEIVQIY